jgi:DNA-binding transcriptional LysR family regulator
VSCGRLSNWQRGHLMVRRDECGKSSLESGALVEIIPDFRRRALAVSLVVAHRSNLSRRVRAFMKWIEDVLTPYLE